MRENEKPPSSSDNPKRDLDAAGVLHGIMSQRRSVIEGLYKFYEILTICDAYIFWRLIERR